MSYILRALALLCFLIAVLVALGHAAVTGEAALIPAGLGFWVGSTLLGGPRS